MWLCYENWYMLDFFNFVHQVLFGHFQLVFEFFKRLANKVWCMVWACLRYLELAVHLVNSHLLALARTWAGQVVSTLYTPAIIKLQYASWNVDLLYTWDPDPTCRSPRGFSLIQERSDWLQLQRCAWRAIAVVVVDRSDKGSAAGREAGRRQDNVGGADQRRAYVPCVPNGQCQGNRHREACPTPTAGCWEPLTHAGLYMCGGMLCTLPLILALKHMHHVWMSISPAGC
jgi:hypothetical protein